MAIHYSVDVCNQLKASVKEAGLHRPPRTGRYDSGDELTFSAKAVGSGLEADVRLRIERFVGGGFAGQVYQIRVLGIVGSDNNDDTIDGLRTDGVYAMKILIPPSAGSCIFRNALYWVGFQGPFQLQVNPAAARAGALWQKFIRRAAGMRFGDENTVNNIHATFVDHNLGACGEFSDWVDGRTWRLEVDNHLDLLNRWRKGKPVDCDLLGSPEYRAKKKFMADFVALLHEVGAHEFARQYEWSTAKSQPNCLKRTSTEGDPAAGLTAVDFRAGLALLPFLPMSPGDFKLIWQGIRRGSLVQFDRGDLGRLEAFVDAHVDRFADMRDALEELKADEEVYRNSLPDVTHNHVKLLYSGKLWGTIFSSAVTGWRVRNLCGDKQAQNLRDSKAKTLLFFLLGIIPFFGRVARKFWARPDWRKHYTSLITSVDYFKRAFRAHVAEKVIVWHRAGRVDEQTALAVAGSMPLFLVHLPLSWMFVWLHRFGTDPRYRADKLHHIFVRPVKLYFNVELREQWMRDMVAEGQRKHILADQDAQTILSRLDEPYIQKYLISLVVHLMTLPVTQVVSVAVAGVYYYMHPEMPALERAGMVGAILVLFQITPVSPGSFCRGLYTTIMAIHDRSFKDYNIALFLSYFKYIGYLAFPIQMSYHYPAISRFMAAHWATEAVHVVPVFGEGGALLEHWIFRIFYNWPLTLRRRMTKIAEYRRTLLPRYWHMPLCAVAATAVFAAVERIWLNQANTLPELRDIWYAAFAIPAVCGACVTAFAGGLSLWKRIVCAAVTGLAVGALYTVITAFVNADDHLISVVELLRRGAWRLFAFTVFSTLGALLYEAKKPDPDLQ
ncbi:MAG: hypothetical protein IH624_15165 [Phycisphaerae bacterium]|nr:hypothetical protein [Phycisphaerae bacterium]